MADDPPDGRLTAAVASASRARAAPRVAYVVLAHGEPVLLRGLIGAVAPAPVLLHVDSATDAATWTQMVAGLPGRVRLLPRRRSRWAGFGQVLAELDGLRVAVTLPVEHVVVMTGQDFPLVWPGHIEAFSAAHPGRSFAATFPIPTPFWEGDGGMRRFTHYNVALGRPFPVRRLRLPARRSLPAGMVPRGGSPYHLLAVEHVRAVLGFCDARPDVVRFWRTVWAPDESFLPSVLHACVPAAEVVNENLWFVDWPPGRAAHPRVLDLTDADRLADAAAAGAAAGGRARTKLFARKLDSVTSAGLLGVLADRVAGPDRSPRPQL